MAGGVSQWFWGVVIYQVSGKLHRSTKTHVSRKNSVRIKSYVNTFPDLHVHVPVYTVSWMCRKSCIIYIFCFRSEPYIFTQFSMMYMYIVTRMFCWVLFVYDCWLMSVFRYRPFLLECPCRDVRYTMARLLERIMSSHFRHGGVPVSSPHPQFNFSKKLFYLFEPSLVKRKFPFYFML